MLAAIACACSDHLDIKRDYGYSVETLPFPKKIKNGETLKIEFSIIREGYYDDTRFQFRYFQEDGTGKLFDDKGRQYDMNRFYSLDSDNFTMLYQSDCNENQKLSLVFQDSFGKKVEYLIEFDSDRIEKE